MSLSNAPAITPSPACPSAKDQTLRACSNNDAAEGYTPPCSKEIWTSVFFDGTNNNKDRDKKDNSYSNVVVLFETHKQIGDGVHFPYYIPGVGTEFEDISEYGENPNGKSMAVGGDARILFAMIQIYNSVHSAVLQGNVVGYKKLVADDVVKTIFKNGGRFDCEGPLDSIAAITAEARQAYFAELDRLLGNAIRNKKPSVTQINLSIFGFSRGAAQARAFSNFMLECCPGSKLAGIPIVFKFMGLFDTVASVGLADSSPIGKGFAGWGKEMHIPNAVECTVHYVAANEVRQNFPLSSARKGNNYPKKCREVVYPGAHSDVGGGYGPGEQGKSVGGRELLASQIPLGHMYQEAFNAGVPLRTADDLKKSDKADVVADLQVHQTLSDRYQAYITWAEVKLACVEWTLASHMRHYWYWRWQNISEEKFKALPSYQVANAQDQVDMFEGNKDFEQTVKKVDAAAIDKKKTEEKPVQMGIYHFIKEVVETAAVVFIEVVGAAVTAANLLTFVVVNGLYYVLTNDEEKIDLLAISLAVADREQAKEVPPLAQEFMDLHIHDSHASFKLLGPLTLFERKKLINEVKQKNTAHEESQAKLNNYLKENKPDFDNHFNYDAEAEARYKQNMPQVTKALNSLERRILNLRLENERIYTDEKDADRLADVPVISDADLKDLHEMASLKERVALGLITKGRRESGSMLRLRQVFDSNNQRQKTKQPELPKKKEPLQAKNDKDIPIIMTF